MGLSKHTLRFSFLALWAQNVYNQTGTQHRFVTVIQFNSIKKLSYLQMFSFGATLPSTEKGRTRFCFPGRKEEIG